MPSRERIVDRGTRRATTIVMDLGRELHQGRLQHGLSQEIVGQAVGMSDTEVGRIERGQIRHVSIVNLSRLLGTVGLELSVRAFPTGSPLRDKGQLALLGLLQQAVAREISWQSEVPVGGTGDLRAWGAVLRLGDQRMGVEAETRLTDFQATERRIWLKCRDSGIPHAILLLADTRSNRAICRTYSEAIARSFPMPGRLALRALRDGTLPTASSIILI